jgi:hypothetical protein
MHIGRKTVHGALMSSKTVIVGVLAAGAAVAGLLAEPSRASQQKPHRCAGAAVAQARKLLVFHVGNDDRITIDPAVKSLAPIRNPVNRNQRFDVLELWGNVYKGEYRMRLIYAQAGGECVLMGQEILEYAAL